MSPWAAVDRLVERAPDHDRLRAHGLQLIGARRWRAVGRSVPADLLSDERLALISALGAPGVLARVRAAVAGPILLIKGPEIAARYPDPTLRPYGDIDLLLPEPSAAHRSLLAAGFVVDEENDVHRPHHLTPLRWPGSPLPIEIHGTLRAPAWARLPTTADLIDTAVPSECQVDGILAPSRAHHTLIVLAHSWAHAPVERLLDLLDLVVLSEGVDRPTLVVRAEAQNLLRPWNAVTSVAEGLFLGEGGDAPSTPIWARHLPDLRELTLLERTLFRWFGNAWAPTPLAALHGLGLNLMDDFKPAPGQTPRDKGRQISSRLRHLLTPVSEYPTRG